MSLNHTTDTITSAKNIHFLSSSFRKAFSMARSRRTNYKHRPTVPSETFKVCLPRSTETELDNRFLSVRSNTERNLARSADLVLVCRESADSKIAEFIEPPRDQTSCHCYQQLRGTIRPPHRAGHHKLFSGLFEDAPHQMCTKILSVR